MTVPRSSPACGGPARRPAGHRALAAGAAAFGLAATAILGGALTGTANAATAAAAWPTPTTSVPVPATIEVSGAYDGKTQRFYGSGDLGDGGQSEDQAPLFQLKDGAVLSNVVIGAPGADGVHCLGSCQAHGGRRQRGRDRAPARRWWASTATTGTAPPCGVSATGHLSVPVWRSKKEKSDGR
ncbi:pectate lyase [Streptomyces sp. NPDC058301]|uniref:pectate lyase n=1 Tax=Streptomyces sp. NPDC058301 TaxID=3346436 RepID=UPI0036EAA1AF